MRKILVMLCAALSSYNLFAQEQIFFAPPATVTQQEIINNPETECAACREPAVKITFPLASGITVYSNHTLSFKQSIVVATVPTKYIRSIKADLTYFEFQPESDDCLPCNKSAATMGNFSTSTLANQNATGIGTHSITWAFLPPKTPGTFPTVISFTLPPSVLCCPATIRWCVRYSIEFDDCTVCSKTVCYEKKKTTVVTSPLPPPTTLQLQN